MTGLFSAASRRFRGVAAAALIALSAAPAPLAAQDEAALLDTGNRLAALLRAGRSVVSANQKLINDPTVGDKQLGPDAFLHQVTEVYENSNGEPPLTESLPDWQRALTEAQLQAMREVVAENQGLINTKDMGFKGFIPAVFARLVNERFGEIVGGAAQVKVTAPPDLVRNRKARPDAWESDVIAARFLTPDWEKGAAWHETVATADGEAFRMLIPEYYGESCLSCHGEPAGEVDVTGFPREGGKQGDLGGAISIILNR